MLILIKLNPWEGGAIADFGLKGGLPSAESDKYHPGNGSNDKANKVVHNLLRSSMRILLKRTTSPSVAVAARRFWLRGFCISGLGRARCGYETIQKQKAF